MNWPNKFKVKKIILLRLAGGLGNQLFQLGFALDYASRNKCKLLVSKAHIGSYDTVHEYVLESIFEIDSIITSNHIIDFILRLRLPRLFPILSRYVCFVSDSNMQKSLKINFKDSKVVILDGYFQKFYKNVDYSYLKSKIKERHCKNSNLIFDISIHVRGGDFLKLGYTNKDISDFYKNAIIELKKMYSDFSRLRVVVITDDRRFVNEIPSLQGLKILDGSVIDDFISLLNSQTQVYASSTFAISAALLSDRRKTKFSTCVWMDGTYRYSMENEKCIKI
jgi:hypothetical protein